MTLLSGVYSEVMMIAEPKISQQFSQGKGEFDIGQNDKAEYYSSDIFCLNHSGPIRNSGQSQ